MHLSIGLIVGLILFVAAVVAVLVIRAILIRRAVTAAITAVFALLYLVFPADILIDPLFIGHLVSALLLFYSLGKMFGPPRSR